MPNNILPFGGSCHMYPDFFSPAEAQKYLTLFQQQLLWEQKSIRLFGKEVMQPRLVSYYGDPNAVYTYSGKPNFPNPWHPDLLAIKQKLEHEFSLQFNAVLCNLYRNGMDSMGQHSDNEKEMGKQPTIASISLGATRKFEFIHKNTKEKIAIQLQNGSLLLMSGTTQEHWYHHLPKQKNCAIPRINLTFRLIVL